MPSCFISLTAIRVLLLSILTYSGLIQASPGYLIAEKEDWIIEKSISLPDEIPESGISDGIYYLSLDKQLRVDESTEKNYNAITTYITNRSGIDESSQINIYYDPTYESITLHSVSIKRNQTVIPQLSDAKISELRTEPELSNLIYNGDVQINIILNDVRVGDIIEYSYTREGANPIYNGHFSYTRYQQWNSPIFHQSFRLLWLKESDLNVGDQFAHSSISQSSISGGQLFEFEVSNSKEIRLDQDTPDSINPYNRVYFTEANSWQDVVDWSLPLYETVISQDSRILDIAKQIKHEHNTKDQQVAAALAYVQENIRYFGIELGKNSHQPSHPLTTLKRRYGDCKDKVVLLISILKALDVQASPALVNTEIKGLLKETPPIFHAFDHVIVKVNLNNKTYWLDPTRLYQYGPLDAIYQANYDFALVLEKGSNALTQMKIKSNSSTRIFEEYDFISDNTVNFTVRTVYKGLDAERFYDRLLSNGLQKIQDDYLTYYQSYFSNLTIQNKIKVSDYETSGVLEIVESYQFDIDIKQYDFEMPFSAYNISEYLVKPSDTDRQYSYDQYSPTNQSHHIKVNLPKHKFDIEDYEFQNNNRYFDYSLKLDFDEEESILNLAYQFNENRRVVDIKDFDQYLKDLDESDNNTSFTLSNIKHKKIDKRNFLGLTLENLLVYIHLISIILFVVMFILLVSRYYIKRKNNYYNFENQHFYPISIKKFFLMSLFTFGLFSIFWNYKNWSYIEEKYQKSFWKAVRSVFHALTFYSFNNWANKESLREDTPNVYSKDVALLILLGLVSFSIFNIYNNNIYDYLLVILSILAYIPFIRYFNSLNNKELIDYNRNSELTIFHYIFFIVSLPALLITAIPISSMNSEGILAGDKIYQSQIHYFQQEGMIDVNEEIQIISSSASFDIRDNGSGFTNKSIFRYWQEDEGGFYFYSLPLSEITEIDTKFEDEYTKLDISFSNNNDLDLYVFNAEKKGYQFIYALKEAWQANRL